LLVTHRIDDIILEFDHGVILDYCKIIAEAKRDHILISFNLNKAFGLKIKVISRAGRYWVYV